MTVVLDTSALLALLWGEPGDERVAAVLSGAKMSTVNLAELVAKLVDRGATDGEAIKVVDKLAVETVAFDAAQAIVAGLLRRETRGFGLSVGDRACLALAQREGATALTTDRAWRQPDLGVAIEVIR